VARRNPTATEGPFSAKQCFEEMAIGRRRAEKALTAVVAEAYLLGVSTRKVEDPVQSLRRREALEEPAVEGLVHNEGQVC